RGNPVRVRRARSGRAAGGGAARLRAGGDRRAFRRACRQPNMNPLAIIRALPGCDGSVALARSMGLDARAFPLFAMRACAWQAPDPGQFDAVLAGSANAFRHGGKGLAGLRELAVLAVGEATAEAARGAGFSVEATGQDGLQSVLD